MLNQPKIPQIIQAEETGHSETLIPCKTAGQNDCAHAVNTIFATSIFDWTRGDGSDRMYPGDEDRSRGNLKSSDELMRRMKDGAGEGMHRERRSERDGDRDGEGVCVRQRVTEKERGGEEEMQTGMFLWALRKDLG